LLTYALPHLAVQARIELIRVHLALAGLASWAPGGVTTGFHAIKAMEAAPA